MIENNDNDNNKNNNSIDNSDDFANTKLEFTTIWTLSYITVPIHPTTQ